MLQLRHGYGVQVRMAFQQVQDIAFIFLRSVGACSVQPVSYTPLDVYKRQDCVRALEETVPAWQPPEHGYHPHTYGVMLDELMLG